MCVCVCVGCDARSSVKCEAKNLVAIDQSFFFRLFVQFQFGIFFHHKLVSLKMDKTVTTFNINFLKVCN